MRQTRHGLLPDAAHDEAARQGFVRAFRDHLAKDVLPGVADAYQTRIEPAFRKAEGRKPSHRRELRRWMTADPYYQLWSFMQRLSQEQMWDSVIDTVERTLPDMIHRTKFGNGPGALKVDPNFNVPRYHTGADIHIQPGAYHTDACADDVAAGAIYDRALYIYAAGMLGGENEALALLLIDFFKRRYPGRTPAKILDMGCAVGNCTVPWARAFPDAVVHGIDVGAPCVRYAHGRAKSLGVNVSFSQQNAERTDYADGSFDLVVSHILLHETSHPALFNILTEARRLLKPGGVMLHLDIARTAHLPPLQGFLLEWEVWNNNEHFYGQIGDIDLVAACVTSGFDRVKTALESVRTGGGDDNRLYNEGGYDWPILVAEH